VVIIGTAIVAALTLEDRDGVNIIGEIRVGLPKFALPVLVASEFLPLIPLPLMVSFVGFLESISVAKTLAAKRRQKDHFH
jgi:sulfate permease, SulP family